MSSPLDIAKQEGYSDEEIGAYLVQKNPAFKSKYEEALKEGYSPKEIFSHLTAAPKESLKSNVGRQVGRSAARIGETILGAPREFGEFLESFVPEKLIKKGAEKIGLGKGAETLLEATKKYAPYKFLPKIKDVKSGFEQIFGEGIKPKNQWEEKADELISDFTALALPFPGQKIKFLKPALLSLGGNVAKEIVAHLGGSEKHQAYAKIGTILVGSLINPGAAEALKNDLYSKARNARAPDSKIFSRRLSKSLEVFEKDLSGGGSETWKEKIFTKIKEIREKINNGYIEIEELEKFKTSINNIASELYTEKKVPKPGIKKARLFTKTLGKIVDKALEDYGKTNPEWESYYRAANEAHGAIAQSHKARNFIERIAKKYGHHAALPLLGIGHFAGAGATIEGVIGTAAAGTTLLTAGEIVSKMRSPVLQKLYLDLVISATKEDAVAVRNNLAKLEKEIQKEELQSKQPNRQK